MALAIGLISLTYTVNDGTTILDTYMRNGRVNVANLSCYHMKYLPNDSPNDEVTKQTVAHTYGKMNLAGKFEPYEDIAQVLRSQDDSRFYWRQTRQKQQLAYRFKEYVQSKRHGKNISLLDEAMCDCRGLELPHISCGQRRRQGPENFHLRRCRRWRKG